MSIIPQDALELIATARDLLLQLHEPDTGQLRAGVHTEIDEWMAKSSAISARISARISAGTSGVNKMAEYVYVIYDSRYHSAPDAAIVLTTEDTLDKAREFARAYPGSVIMRCVPRPGNPSVWDEDRVMSHANPFFESIPNASEKEEQ